MPALDAKGSPIPRFTKYFNWLIEIGGHRPEEQAVTATKIPDRGEPRRRGGERRSSPRDDGLEVVLRSLARWRGASGGVTIVAIDGHGASGKSTIAESLRAKTGASLVRTDDFFVPRAPARGGPAGPRLARPAQIRRAIGSFYDVARMRAEALEPLRAGREAVFRPYDWDAGAVSRARTARRAERPRAARRGLFGSPGTGRPRRPGDLCGHAGAGTPAPAAGPHRPRGLGL